MFLVARVTHLLEKGIAPEEIIVLTRDPAAREAIENDIKKTAGELCILPRIVTFSAFSEELVTRHADILGVKEDVCALPPDEVMRYAQRLLGTDPFLRNQYGKQTRYLLVDDFNALSGSELALVDLLGAAWRNICVIGSLEPARTLFDVRTDHFQTFRAQYIGATEIIL